MFDARRWTEGDPGPAGTWNSVDARSLEPVFYRWSAGVLEYLGPVNVGCALDREGGDAIVYIVWLA